VIVNAGLLSGMWRSEPRVGGKKKANSGLKRKCHSDGRGK
jgi:hypothetical protein